MSNRRLKAKEKPGRSAVWRKTESASTLKRTDDYFGFGIGSGFGMKRIIFDIAYRYRFGNNVGASVMKSMNFSQDVKEHTVYSSVNFRF